MVHDSVCDWIGAATSAVTALSIIVGGIVVARRYRLFRRFSPRADLSHSLAATIASDDSILVRVVLTVANKGEVRLDVGKLFVRLQQVSPCDAAALDAYRESNEYKTEGDWPVLRRKTIADAKCHVEPGENQQFEFDLELPRDVDTFGVYSYVANDTMPGRGWDHSSWHHLKDLLP